ncbi:GNAT family N-acetyltransferase [Alkalihalobacillus trypoxylicola]|nr:GNAT family protein [Alkalihalobacillus trypoxylicola]
MGDLIIAPMSDMYAKQILQWTYDKPYDFYNMPNTLNSYFELMNGTYYVVCCKPNDLIGFFCYGKSAQVPAEHHQGLYNYPCIDIGLGLHPQLTGKGMGYSFFNVVSQFIQTQQPNYRLRLTVASFNKRAIKLYQKFHFKEVASFQVGKIDFLIMIQ